MPQLTHYILLTCQTRLTAPQVKFNLPLGSANYSGHAALAWPQLVKLLTVETRITGWTGHDPAGATQADGVLVQDGLVDETFTDTHYGLFLRINTAVRVKRPSTQYVMAFPSNFMANGLLTGTGLAQMTSYSSGIVGAGFCDSEGHVASSVEFRHFTRRQNVNMVV